MKRPKDEGGALVSVMAVGLLLVSAGLWLADALMTEYRSVEDSLTEVRVYWAGMGQAAYVLSRTMQSGACSGACPKATTTSNPPDFVSSAQSYVKEITTPPTNLQSWLYPDISANYKLTLAQKVCLDPLAPSAQLGEMLFLASVSGAPPCPPAPPANSTVTATKCPAAAKLPAGTLPALRLVNIVRPVEIRYCLVATGATACGAGPGATTAGATLITSVHRPAC